MFTVNATPKPYTFSRFPLNLHRGDRSIQVQDEAEEKAAIEKGYSPDAPKPVVEEKIGPSLEEAVADLAERVAALESKKKGTK